MYQSKNFCISHIKSSEENMYLSKIRYFSDSDIIDCYFERSSKEHIFFNYSKPIRIYRSSLVSSLSCFKISTKNINYCRKIKIVFLIV